MYRVNHSWVIYGVNIGDEPRGKKGDEDRDDGILI